MGWDEAVGISGVAYWEPERHSFAKLLMGKQPCPMGCLSKETKHQPGPRIETLVAYRELLALITVGFLSDGCYRSTGRDRPCPIKMGLRWVGGRREIQQLSQGLKQAEIGPDLPGPCS